MAGSEATAENDKPPAAVSPKTDANGASNIAPAATKEPARVDDPGEEVERDEFGLPVRPKRRRHVQDDSDSEDGESQAYGTPGEKLSRAVTPTPQQNGSHQEPVPERPLKNEPLESTASQNREEHQADESHVAKLNEAASPTPDQARSPEPERTTMHEVQPAKKDPSNDDGEARGGAEGREGKPSSAVQGAPFTLTDAADRPRGDQDKRVSRRAIAHESKNSQPTAISEFSHQALAPREVEHEKDQEEDDWKAMPAFAPYDIYDDDNRLVAREEHDSDNEANAYTGLGGAGKGYTRVQVDEDAKSATSMDDNTEYLFKSKGTELHDEDEDQRDPLAQLQTTKTLLSEGQKIAYVGVTRLAMGKMVKELENAETTRKTKKQKTDAIENMKMWSQKMMVRLYGHMDIDVSEQVMIEQLAEHGVEPEDLTPALMQNARVKNPMAEENAEETPANSSSLKSPKLDEGRRGSGSSPRKAGFVEDEDDEPLPEYKEHEDDAMPEVRSPSQLGTGRNIDIDLRWTVLCDLFLVLIADSIYDSRSRVLLEKVGESLKVSWLEICRFEKRVTDSLEMQESSSKETWDEAEHLESRRKQALRRKYMMMGLATVGGSLVIGLSAGALAPVIGAGLAAGFTTIGVAGTSGFLAGAGGTALITSGAVITGGTIGVKASKRRMGHVRTFEYRPLHNNKRVNLIVTISGWMNGKIDDVRLPYSTVDPIMGDMYSVLWEPEMLTSMGDTINILATEALTQTVQQVLGSTILIALMASLQLPIVLSKLSYLIDNPWTVSMVRANAAGLILADSLIDRNLGARPITLVGFSLGARVIFAAMRELANRGAYGLIQNVYLFGSPIIANKEEYLRARAVISGRFVNGYATNDWILGYLFRATGGGLSRVAGLAKVEGIAGLENVDVTSLVNGHMAYRTAMPKLLRLVGWEVESDEFTEIEDPDPENHQARQRELIKEIDDARKVAEEKPEKRRFGFFKKGKLAEKKGWETYDDKMKAGEDDFGTTTPEGQGNVLFDIEAIKRELASEQIEVKQLPSTLPPMKLTINDFKSPGEQSNPHSNPYSNLRETKSYDGTGSSTGSTPSKVPATFKASGQASQSSLPSDRNPFNQGYDEYDLSHEAIDSNGIASADHGKISFDHSELGPSPMHSPRFSQGSPGLPPGSPLRQEMEKDSNSAQRPPLESAATAPASASPPPPAIDHNAWADEEDEDFGKEKEVTMSFG